MKVRFVLTPWVFLLTFLMSGCFSKKVETVPVANAAPVKSTLSVDVISMPSEAAIVLNGRDLGKTPQSISVDTASDLVQLKAAIGDEEAKEKRIRFASPTKAKVSFLFAKERSAMAKTLGLAKILVFEFGESITFDVDSHDLKPAFAGMLDRQAEMLNLHFKDLQIYVCGHTDSMGNADYNLSLSLARAQSVANHLSSRGLPRSRMKIQGFGSAFPLASNDTSEGRAQNRRTEVILPQ